MNKSLLILAIMIVAVVESVASQNKPDENFILKRFESNIAFDYLQEFSTSFSLYVDKLKSRGKTKIAVRLCSNSPMKSAVTKGAIDLSAIYKAFEGYGFIGMDVIVLRSDGCVSKVNLTWPTELWVINNVNTLPPYKEKLYSNEIISSEIGDSIVRFVGNRNYVINAKSLASELAKNENTFGMVYIAHRGANKTVANSFRKKIVDILTLAGINQSRYSIELIRWNSRLSSEPLGKLTIFPEFHLVTTKSN